MCMAVLYHSLTSVGSDSSDGSDSEENELTPSLNVAKGNIYYNILYVHFTLFLRRRDE